MTLKDVRLTAGSGNLSPGQIYREVFSFEGLLAQTHFGADAQGLDTAWKETPMGG
jgi:hypothetical protein